MDVVIFLVTPRVGAMVIAALIALVPAAVSAWRDHVLLARGREDPALPERLLATQSWVIGSIAFSIALLVTLFRWHWIWALPLLFVSRRAVAYRLRRTLLGETWSFARYLDYFVRTALGLVAISLVLACAPLIVSAALDGAPRWIVAIMLSALLIWWHVRATHLVLWLWRATPIRLGPTEDPTEDAHEQDQREEVDPALAAAFSAILAKATIATPPRVWWAGPPGAVVANAIALPSPDTADIVISRTLIDRCTLDEIVAIFAHEVAHLEHFTRARVIRLRITTYVLIAGGVLLVPMLTALAAEQYFWPAMLAWLVMLVVTGFGRGAKAHGNELAADRRAIELCANPDALIVALTRLQGINCHPRRWNARATKHPSYAQRIRAIREAAGFHAPTIEQIEIFASPLGSAFLLLDRATLQHASGVPAPTATATATAAVAAAAANAVAASAPAALASPGASPDPHALLASAQHVRRLPYTSLKSCRIITPWKSPAALQVTELNGRRFEAQVRDDDLPRLHDLLDIIEFGLPMEKPAPPLNERAVAFGLLIVSMLIGQIWSLALLALLALISPVAEMLIGAALALSVAGLLQWLDPTSVTTLAAATHAVPAWVIVALGGIAVDFILWRLWSGRASQAKAPAWCVAIVLGTAAIVWLHGLLQWDGSLLRLAQVARLTPAAMLLPLAGAVLVARVPVRGRRVFAAVLVIAAMVPAAMTTRWFQDEVVRDPLLSDEAVPLAVTSGEADMIGAVSGDRDDIGTELRLSPEGHAMATAAIDPESERIEDFTIRAADGTTRDVHADDLQFVDDTRALVLVNQSDGLVLRLENLAGKSAPEWSLTLPGLRWSRLSFSPRTRHWRVIGHDSHGQVARLQGSLGEADYDDVRWKVDERGAALVGSGNAMLISRTDWRASLLGRLLPELAMATSRRSAFDVSLWRVRAGAPTLMAQSSADVDCIEAPVDLDPAVCFAFDGIATRVWILHADDRRVTPAGVLQGYARPLTRGSDGTLVAWWRRHPVLLQLDPLRARELSTIPISRWARVALAADHLLIADAVSTDSTLAVYRVQTEQTELTSRSAQP